MKKIYKLLVNIGTAISALIVFSPFLIAAFYKNVGECWWVLLILSILYDVYWYNDIQRKKIIKDTIMQIKDVEKRKGVFETKEAKHESYKAICQQIVEKFDE